eukprot:6142953-Alexandrium_andersonii.AAC.1
MGGRGQEDWACGRGKGGLRHVIRSPGTRKMELTGMARHGLQLANCEPETKGGHSERLPLNRC